MRHQISSDKHTVWINSGINGICLGRFSKNGWEVKKNGSALEWQAEMSRGPCNDEDWGRFKRKCEFYHSVKVADKHKPIDLK